jgi:hypothetical protein
MQSHDHKHVWRLIHKSEPLLHSLPRRNAIPGATNCYPAIKRGLPRDTQQARNLGLGWPGEPIMVAAHGALMLPVLHAFNVRRRFSTVVCDVATAGNSEQMPARHQEPKSQQDIAKYFMLVEGEPGQSCQSEKTKCSDSAWPEAK